MKNYLRRLWTFFLLLLLLQTSCLSPVSLPVSTPTPPPPSPTVTSSPTFTPTQPPTQTQTATPSPTPTQTVTPAPQFRRVLLLSIDGLRPDSIPLAPMPNLLTLMQSGAYSVNARTTFPSATLPSHASMLTGLCPQKHAVTWNDYLPEYGYAQGTDLFDLAHAAGLKTAMVVGKKKLIQITEPPSLDYFLFVNDRDLILAQRLSVEAPIDFNLLFVHFALTDMMGHEYGWNSPNQLSVIRRADEALGLTLAWLEANALRQETLLLITSDHGGHEFTHGSSDPQDMTIPWVLSGAGVRPGLLNTPIQTTDTAATLAWALRLPLPPEWDGIPILEAFGQPQPLRLQPFCEDR